MGAIPLQSKEQRIVFIDYIRVIACFLVMLVHASENFYAADASGLAGNVSMLANEANRFWVAFYDGFVGRTCVPLFMIVSAFLLVPMKPGQTMTEFYRRRFCASCRRCSRSCSSTPSFRWHGAG